MIGDCLAALAARIPSVLPQISSEESAKLSLVLPFFSALGYDTSDVTKLEPEFQVGGGRRVDFAVKQGGNPVLLVECKSPKCGIAGTAVVGQLARYFDGSGAKFGLLTNGVVYRFFGSLDSPGLMDRRPFLEVDFEGLVDSDIPALGRFVQDFDVAAAESWARRMQAKQRELEGGRANAEGLGFEVLAGIVGREGLRFESHASSANFYWWPGLRTERRRLCRLDFLKSGMVLRLYGGEGNYNELDRVRIRDVGEVHRFADVLRERVGDV